MGNVAAALKRVLASVARHPRAAQSVARNLPEAVQARRFTQAWSSHVPASARTVSANPLRAHFDSHHTGPGIMKWSHYFDPYHRHFQKFVGREVHVLEIGIFSGGSLGMWHAYFGSQLHLYGVDIEPACQVYAADRTRIFTGDQADRSFWKRFRQQVPRLDAIIDDGGHSHHQQIATLEELLPHLAPGGVYLCEDIHGLDNGFAAYLAELSTMLHALGEHASPFQRDIASIHVYPYLAVIEKHETACERFAVEQRGTEWQPPLPHTAAETAILGGRHSTAADASVTVPVSPPAASSGTPRIPS
jgi:hypothetical protein